ncbi:MAG: hypothetical protein N4Q32_02850, partial [Neisseriaceae bacterium]|nr:hypothetical protein [Neisseriaceae bacterium]
MKKQTTEITQNPEKHSIPCEKEGDLMWNVCRIKQWGLDYFGVDDDGNVCVCPNPENASNKVKLTDIIKLVEQKKGLQLPTLVCFPQILQHRLKSINAAFKKAREDFDYKNDYFLVYPIKVNQS